ncbi:ABC transporter permease [Actinomadura sp. SCN-SB]|uniref:ABC transporter permease n=1 Tax=Actinomadura sp. SCN-SB TaxID=3373092 RepID=UPI003753924A
MTAATVTSRSAAGRDAGRVRALTVGVLQRWLPLAILVVCWEAVTRTTTSAYFPPPSDIVKAMHELWFTGPASSLFLNEEATGNILPSLGRLALSLFLSALAGIALGIVLGRSDQAMAYLNPVLQFARVIPPPTLVPVFAVLFEFGTQMQVASIIFSAIWPILLNTADGVRSVDPVQADTALVFRLSRTERLRYLIVPSALVKIFAGLRLALSLSLILMVFSELLPGTSNGLGYELTNAQSQSDVPTIWSVIVLLGILGYLFNTILLAVERRVLATHRGARKAAS